MAGRARGWLTRIATLTVLGASLFRSPPALAQSAADTALVEQAEQLSARGDHQAALALVRVVVDRAPTPRAFGVLGLASLRADDPVAAEAAIQRALQTPGDPWVASHKSELNAALVTTSRALGTIIIDNAPDGTAVRIDDQNVGTTPLPPLRARAGSHVVDVGASQTTVTVVAGSTAVTGSSATVGATAVSPPAADDTQVHVEPMPELPTPSAAPTNDQIPETWLRAFPPVARTQDRMPATWTEPPRVNLGVAVGYRIAGVGDSLSSVVHDAGRTATVTLDRSDQSAEQFALSAGLVRALGPMVGAGARVDLTVAPGTLHPVGRVEDANSQPFEALRGSGWAITGALTPNLRLHLGRRNTTYFGLGLRLAVLHAFARMNRHHCTGYDSCRSHDAAVLGTQDFAVTQLLIGGEIALAATLDRNAAWDLSFRAHVDQLALGAMLSLERKIY